ncbi:hypothetical protein [[Mycoplasma] anseris]|uniref:Uncharacterized protein n=1 Tax=[Mycoplasma] anseris TaxID=92400 RepID=A0A2Z4NDC1_9BACT|nr:hypothetical protein [[Mycoplasma] anseris]AWX69527.1 hypothetical protein DP065_02050 [[Mycoplasma] anseris]
MKKKKIVLLSGFLIVFTFLIVIPIAILKTRNNKNHSQNKILALINNLESKIKKNNYIYLNKLNEKYLNELNDIRLQIDKNNISQSIESQINQLETSYISKLVAFKEIKDLEYLNLTNKTKYYDELLDTTNNQAILLKANSENDLNKQKHLFLVNFKLIKQYFDDSIVEEIKNAISKVKTIETVKTWNTNFNNIATNIQILINSYHQETTIKESPIYLKYTQDSKVIFEKELNNIFKVLNNEFKLKISPIENNGLLNEIILINAKLLNAKSLLKLQPNNQAKIELQQSINLLKNKISKYQQQNFYVLNFEEELNIIASTIENKNPINSNEFQEFKQQINNIEENLTNFINEANTIPTDYKTLSISYFPQLEKNSNTYIVEKNSEFRVKIFLNFNNKQYPLNYLKQHNISIRYYLEEPGYGSYKEVSNDNINYEDSTFNLAFNFNDQRRRMLQLVLRYNNDIDNSAATINTQGRIFIQGIDPEPNNVIPLSLEDFRIIPKNYTNLNNISNVSLNDLKKILAQNWNTNWSNRFSDNELIKYNDMLWVSFFKYFLAANFENEFFKGIKTQFVKSFDKQGSFVFKADAITAQTLSQHHFISLGGSFFNTILESSAYNNVFDLNPEDNVSMIFSLDNSSSWNTKYQATDKPEILNSNIGDLSLVPSKYQINAKYPFIANFFGIFNFKLLINDQIVLNVNNTDANQLKSFPIFIHHKSGSEILFYTSFTKASIG